MKKEKGSTILTTPIMIAIGIMLVSILIVMAVNILTPYIWYEKLSSTCLKYVFVIEEYGYLSKKEASLLLAELEGQGFTRDEIDLDYTSQKVNYGEEIYLKVNYNYEWILPMGGSKSIPMQIEKYSNCKR